ncbi:Reticulon [Sesbania bispinosa]|nr:Reticulon [Sesbania bispinosa]
MAVDDRFADLNPKTCVVLGGRGFLGRSLVLRLLKLGNWIVRVADSAQSLQLHHSESLLAEALSSARASYFHVDLRDKPHIVKVLEGSSVVFYMDVAGFNANDFYSCYKLVVKGAKNVISACRECRVKRLIYNSSADVVFDGLHDIHDGDESLAYPWKMDNMLIDLKAQAEALILSANDIDGLLTCSLRPRTGDNLSDFTFSENVTHAHICAEKALNFQTVSVAGKAFFITNLEPMKFWEFLSLLLEGLGYQRPFIKLPANLVQYILSVLKWLHEKLGPRHFSYPLLVHFFQLASHTRTFNYTAAQKDIGYSPIVSLEEGVTLTIESFSHLARDSSFSGCCGSSEQSKADKLLGGGKVADILLWRDEKTSFTYFLVLVLLFYWFFLSGNTFISSAARLLLLSTLLIYGHGFLPSKLFGFSIQRMPMSNFEISDTVVKDSVATTVRLWNKGFQNIKGLAQGEDWSTFFKVAVILYLLKLMLSELLTTLIGIGLVFAFMAFFVYEQYESEIDGLVDILFTSLKEFTIYLIRILPVSVSRLLHYRDNLQPYKGPGWVKELR